MYTRSALTDDVVRMDGTRGKRAYWLKTLHQWHWISSALCLLGMVMFSVTGITLNHASQIESRPRVETQNVQLPEPLMARLTERAAQLPAKGVAVLPAEVGEWLSGRLSLALPPREAEWARDEVYLSLPRPGGDAWLRIGLEDGAVEYESTDRGWISYFNDLHKGRHSGIAWSWFIDIFAVACLLFSVTGLLILKMHAASRPTTWPMVGLGIVVPLLLALLFIH
jgi:hypothetical protein